MAVEVECSDIVSSTDKTELASLRTEGVLCSVHHGTSLDGSWMRHGEKVNSMVQSTFSVFG